MIDPQPAFSALESDSVSSQDNRPLLHPMTLLLRWIWLPFLGAAIGLGVGGWQWLKTPQLYKAVARIQLVIPGDTSNSRLPIITLAEMLPNRVDDDIVIIQSMVVLRDAIEIGRLESHPLLSDKSSDELMAWLHDQNRLFVEPATNGGNTSIIDVAFRCDDAELAAHVATAIIAGYEKYIGRESQTLSSQVLDKLARFRDDYDIRAKQAFDEYTRLAKAMPLVGNGSQNRDLHFESVATMNQRIDEIRAKIVRYTAAIEIASQSSGQDSGSRESMLLALLARVANNPSLVSDESLSELDASQDANSENKSMRSEQVMLAIGTLKEELTTMKKEEEKLRKMADEHEREGKEQHLAMVTLDAVRQEMDSITQSASELKNTLERLNRGAGYGTKRMKRLEVPTYGTPDGPYLAKILSVSTMAGGLLFAGLWLGIVLIGGIVYLVPRHTPG